MDSETGFQVNSNCAQGSIIVEQFARWTVLAWILTFRIVSKPFRDLYPDIASLEKAGKHPACLI